MSTLYWTNVSGSGEWENDANWFTSDPGGASNPNGAANIVSGNTTGPWTANDAYKSYNLALSSGETGAPTFDINAIGFSIGASDSSWLITGTCSIIGWTNGMPYSPTTVYGGTFSGDGINNQAYIDGGTFSGAGFQNNATIYGGSFTGDGFTNENYGSNIQGGLFSGNYFVNNGNLYGGTYTGTNFTMNGDVHSGATYAPVGTIPYANIINAGVYQYGATTISDPGFSPNASNGINNGSFSPVLTVTGAPSGGGAVSGITKFGT